MNIFNFDSIASAGSADLEFEKPIKSFRSSVDLTLLDDGGNELYPIKADVKYTLPNIFGYPETLYVKNKAGSAVSPAIFVEEFGDVVADPDYFAEPAAIII